MGVGGTLRAMVRYHQELKDYQLDKVHNYQMDSQAVSSIADELYEMDADDLEAIKAVGSNRVDTIAAGGCIINALMQKFGFERIVVSAEGLREGYCRSYPRPKDV